MMSTGTASIAVIDSEKRDKNGAVFSFHSLGEIVATTQDGRHLVEVGWLKEYDDTWPTLFGVPLEEFLAGKSPHLCRPRGNCRR